MNDILVSISCLTYNHERYIHDAIESFFMQKTNFKYEILIHDDASSDRTVEIIKDYEKKYPDLIKPIYQTENQFSKEILVDEFNVKRAKGKYIAVCEGDDYWLDPYKLQKQVDFMENHPECSLCVHAGYVVSAKDKKILRHNRPSRTSRYLQVEEVIGQGGDFFVTNSMFYRTQLDLERPRFFQIVPNITDYHLAINLALQGKVYYMDEFLSAWRNGDDASWTSSNMHHIAKKRAHYRQIAEMLDEINRYTNSQYEQVIKWKKDMTELELLIEERKFKEVKKGMYKELYSQLGLKRKAMIWLDEYSPAVSNFLRQAKRSFVKWNMT